MKPNKSLGQNFLTDAKVLGQIVATANLKGDETVVEVGGGDGFLTRGLESQVKSQKSKVESFGKILVLEYDYRLVEKLRGEYKNSKVVKIIHQDALRFDWENLPKDYKIVANIPYQITSPLLNLWTFRLKNQPSEMTLMVQKEVGERLSAPPGSAKRGLTTILVELYGNAEYVASVPAKAFSPAPKVDSAIIKIVRSSSFIDDRRSSEDQEPRTLTDRERSRAIIRIAKMGFSAKRKTLSNSLSGTLRLPKDQTNEMLKKAGINPSRRAETLTINEWQTLTRILKDNY